MAFDIAPPSVEEPKRLSARLSPVAVAQALAYFKARSVTDGQAPRRVLGADTIVVVDEEIMGKPADVDDARRMLRRLSSTPHEVITGVAILDPKAGRVLAAERTRVTMRPMTDDQVEGYIATGEWEGKAGAYAIQESADRYVDRLEGSFSNVVGLPIELVGRLLAELDAAGRSAER